VAQSRIAKKQSMEELLNQVGDALQVTYSARDALYADEGPTVEKVQKFLASHMDWNRSFNRMNEAFGNSLRDIQLLEKAQDLTTQDGTRAAIEWIKKYCLPSNIEEPKNREDATRIQASSLQPDNKSQLAFLMSMVLLREHDSILSHKSHKQS